MAAAAGFFTGELQFRWGDGARILTGPEALGKGQLITAAYADQEDQQPG
jgi:hypothetical protein